MKVLFISLIAISTVLFACKSACNSESPDNNLQEGQITGQDFRKCACCGGWFIKTADTTYFFISLPVGTNIDLQNATFPIPVKFDYTPDTSFCNGLFNRIILTQIEVI